MGTQLHYVQELLLLISSPHMHFLNQNCMMMNSAQPASEVRILAPVKNISCTYSAEEHSL